MFYRSTDPSFSTRDWLSINVNMIPQSLIFDEGDDVEKLYERLTEILPDNRGIKIPEFHVEPTEDEEREGVTLYLEPERDEYEEGVDGDLYFADDHKVWEAYDEEAREVIRQVEEGEIELLPMHGWFFQTEDHPELREFVFAEGLRLYEHDSLGKNEVMIGIDGGGYSFYGQHWVPLRARIAKSCLKAREEQIDPALRSLLIEEARSQGGSASEIEAILDAE